MDFSIVKIWLLLFILWVSVGVVYFVWSTSVTREEDQVEYLRRAYLRADRTGPWLLVGFSGLIIFLAFYIL